MAIVGFYSLVKKEERFIKIPPLQSGLVPMSLALRGRMKVLRTAALRAAGRGGICDPLPEGIPIRPSSCEDVQPALFVPEQIGRVTHCAFRSTNQTSALADISKTLERTW